MTSLSCLQEGDHSPGLAFIQKMCFNKYMHTNIEIGDLKIKLVRKRIKNLHLSVRPPSGLIQITAPLMMDFAVIHDFVLSKFTWIKKQQRHIQKYVYEPEPAFVEPKILRAHLQRIVPPMVERWEAALKVKASKVSFRAMRTRWGSCTPDDATIRLSLNLAHKSDELVEYVVLHELIHLLEPSHNHRFKSFMDLHMPDWRLRKMKLNGRRP